MEERSLFSPPPFTASHDGPKEIKTDFERVRESKRAGRRKERLGSCTEAEGVEKLDKR